MALAAQKWLDKLTGVDLIDAAAVGGGAEGEDAGGNGRRNAAAGDSDLEQQIRALRATYPDELRATYSDEEEKK